MHATRCRLLHNTFHFLIMHFEVLCHRSICPHYQPSVLIHSISVIMKIIPTSEWKVSCSLNLSLVCLCPALGGFSHPVLAISHVLGFSFNLPLKGLNVDDAFILQCGIYQLQNLLQVTGFFSWDQSLSSKGDILPFRFQQFIVAFQWEAQDRGWGWEIKPSCSRSSGTSLLPRESERAPA